jgi:hypothetical protein
VPGPGERHHDSVRRLLPPWEGPLQPAAGNSSCTLGACSIGLHAQFDTRSGKWVWGRTGTVVMKNWLKLGTLFV